MDETTPLRLLLLTHYFAPEIGAAQTRLLETVEGLVGRGFRVDVLAPAASYPDGIVGAGHRSWLPRRETIGGARVIRLPSVIVPGARISRRIIGQGSFAVSAMAAVGFARRYDVALVESPPLFLGLPARLLRAAGLPYVFHVADPWPDFPIAMGYLRSAAARRAAFALEAFAYAGAGAITTVSPSIVDLLDTKPSAHGRVVHVPNTVDVGRFASDRRRASRVAARKRLGWDDRFTVLYAGTVGLAQGLDTLLSAAALLDESVAIRIVGDGVERAELEDRAARAGLANVVFHRPVQAGDVPAVLAAADAGVTMLRRGALYEASLPTKLLEAMAAGLPVIVSADGLSGEIVRAADGGYVAPAEDPAALAAAIATCQADTGRTRRGASARAYVTANYDRSVAIDRLASVLRDVAAGASLRLAR